MSKLTLEQEEMVLANQKLVPKVIRDKFLPFIESKTVDMDDLMSEGLLALVKCARGFDPSLGAKFSTYAYRSIEMEVRNFILHQGNDNKKLRYSKPAIRDAYKIKKAGLQQLTAKEIAKELKITVSRAEGGLLYLNENSTSGDSILSDGVHTLFEIIPDDRGTFMESIHLTEFISTLDEDEKIIISLRFNGLDQSQIADRVGRTQSVVSRRISKIKKKYQEFNTDTIGVI